MYYDFDNRPFWFKEIWRVVNIFRRCISKLQYQLKYFGSQTIALFVYLPLSRFSVVAEKIGLNVTNIPLSLYRDKSFYSMRTDALDRFGTRLEKRFTKIQIKIMMVEAGLERIEFSDKGPYWCAIGHRIG